MLGSRAEGNIWDIKKVAKVIAGRPSKWLQHPKQKTTAPRIPAWSPTVVLTRRHFG
jgi:hypothetical protein